MKRKLRIALIIILVAALAAAVVLYLISRGQKECDSCNSLEGVQINSSTASAVSTPIASVSKSSSPQTSSLVYENSIYKFKITLSEVWKDYSVEKATAPSDQSAEIQLDFVLPSSSGRAVPLSILVYPIDKVSEKLTGSVEIKRNSQYVFGYKTWSAAPSDLQQVTEKEIADRLETFVTY
ncbi:MAG: hypothetical protein OEV37_00950 [Candidatus Berkelbacteria bacterium]|nr:hypothetical protein [Candidatus Berkelbacteria bacterium]